MIFEGKLTQRQRGRSSRWTVEQPGKGGITLADGQRIHVLLGETWIEGYFLSPTTADAAQLAIGGTLRFHELPARDGMTIRAAVGSDPLPELFVVELHRSIALDLRDVQHVSSGPQTIPQILATCADHVSQGLTRPGAWEASICSSLGFERGPTWGRSPEHPWRCAPFLVQPPVDFGDGDGDDVDPA